MVLLTGGTDGGNSEVLLAAARDLVDSGWTGPVVVAGNVEAQDEVGAILGGPAARARRQRRARGSACSPRTRARAAIREMFLAHVIGGKHLSARTDFTAMVRGATPDVVLTGVELLAAASTPTVGHGRRGGRRRRRGHHRRALRRRARPRGQRARPRGGRHHAGHPHRRGRPRHALVGGDHRRGGRAPTLAEAARATPRRPGLPARHRRRARTSTRRSPPAAIGLALRRHAGRSRVVVSPEGRVVERTGKDLREVDLLVGSGGVLRNGRPGVAERVLAGSIGADRGRLAAAACTPRGRRPRLRPGRRGLLAARTPRRRTGWSCGSPGSVACRREQRR